MCRFCEIYKNKTEIELESSDYFMILDQYPVSPGHMIVIPTRHLVSLFDLNKHEWDSLKDFIHESIKLLSGIDLYSKYANYIDSPLNEKSKYFCQAILHNRNTRNNPDGFNIGVNEGAAAGRTVDHLHIHIIPRFEGDVLNPVGGIRNIFPGTGDYRT
jgi:ATP adenylyltransferase